MCGSIYDWTVGTSVSGWPVQEPGLFCAGEGRTQFLGLSGNGGVLELLPGKVPLLCAPRRDRAAVDCGAQVGVDPRGKTGFPLASAAQQQNTSTDLNYVEMPATVVHNPK